MSESKLQWMVEVHNSNTRGPFDDPFKAREWAEKKYPDMKEGKKGWRVMPLWPPD